MHNKTSGQRPHVGDFTLGVEAKRTTKSDLDSKAFRLGFQAARLQQQKRELEAQEQSLMQAAMQLLAIQAQQAQQAQDAAAQQQQALAMQQGTLQALLRQQQMQGAAAGGGVPNVDAMAARQALVEQQARPLPRDRWQGADEESSSPLVPQLPQGMS